jgi:hypothetical protein
MNEKLEPCKCGETPEMQTRQNDLGQWWEVVCQCGERGMTTPTEAGAEHAWDQHQPTIKP